MEIIRQTITKTFRESIGDYRFEGTYVEEDNKVISLSANVNIVVDEANDVVENLAYITLRKQTGKTVKDICKELIAGIQTLINNLDSDES